MAQFAGFQSVKLNKPTRSAFDLSHQKRLTTRMGRLTPVLITECIPSDTFRGGSEVLVRLAPLLAPIYDSIEVFVHFYFVPNRLLWEDWEKFITGGRLGVGIDPVSAPVPPFVAITNMTGTGLDQSSLLDYLGVPPLPGGAYAGINLDMMPALAYQLVWYEYYRDRNFVPDDVLGPFPVPSGVLSGANEYLVLRKRSYLHDYFTSALPFTQRGEEVLLPVALSGFAPLYVEPDIPPGSTSSNILLNGLQDAAAQTFNVLTGDPVDSAGFPNGAQAYIRGEDFAGSATSINDFRAAYALQVWLERNAIGGSRYTESTEAHFGVKPQDSRIQRPEYIGGGRIQVKISEVVATAWSSDGSADVPQANMAGHGITYGNTNRFNYFCVEHGFIIGIMSIMNPPSYQQGLPRMFMRRSFLDYPWPTFAKLGEQPVHDWEIFANATSLTEDADGEFPLFGYQSRYADWKYMCSTNHGEFRSTLLFWTLIRTFTTQPVLSETFNEFQDPTQDRIFAVGGPLVDNFWCYVFNSVNVKRPLPYFGTPNTMGFN